MKAQMANSSTGIPFGYAFVSATPFLIQLLLGPGKAVKDALGPCTCMGDRKQPLAPGFALA